MQTPTCAGRADHEPERHRYYQSIDFDSRPSELFRRHFWGCFIDDETGLANSPIDDCTVRSIACETTRQN